MKVILLKDVNKVGKKDEIIEVSDGYANNFLIPRGLAVRSTSGSQTVLKEQQKEQQAQRAREYAEAIALKEKLAGITLHFVLKVGESGKPFGSISLKQVESELKDKHKIIIDKRKFVSKNPIHDLGVTTLKIELLKNVIAEINVEVKEG